jgi:hypothetical protein
MMRKCRSLPVRRVKRGAQGPRAIRDPVPIRKDASAAFLLSLEGPLKDDGLDQQERQLHALL